MVRQDALAGQIGIRQLSVVDKHLHEHLAKHGRPVRIVAQLHIQDGNIIMQDLVELRRDAAGRDTRLGGNRVFHQAHVETDTGIVDEQLIGPADTGQAPVFIDSHKIVGIEIIFPVDLLQFKDDVAVQPPAAHSDNITYDKESLINTARKNDWLKPEGTPLYCLGNLLAYSGFFVSRRYDSTLEDIRRALEKDNDVVIGVDREKLYAEEIDLEDLTNHAVVVTKIDNDAITIFDPYEDPYVKRVPIPDFLNAWKESHNYMIQVFQSADEYEPHPINVDSIPLDEDLEELIEAIAENAHDIWAEKMMKDGWTYGKERDELKKQDPCILPYTALPDDEKEYDRLMAYNTIKLVKKLGFGNTIHD